MLLCFVCTAGCDPAEPGSPSAGTLSPSAETAGSDPTRPAAGPLQPIDSQPTERQPHADDPRGSSPDSDPDITTTANAGSRLGGPAAPTGTPARRFRLPPDGREPDVAQLAAHGIRAYESTHLLLLSDIPAEQAADLPAVADLLFSQLEESLGSLAPAPDGTPFRVTGCLIDAPERFTAAGLMPSERFAIRHGRHLNYRFWMFNPPSDYYRRHLLLHEFVHCFMNCEYGMFDIPPLWFTEGIAEYFATHSLATPDGRPAMFGVLPSNIDAFHGWGRIAEIRRSFQNQPDPAVTDAGFTALHRVIDPLSPVYDTDSQYAHAWALFWLLQNHPVCRTAFGSFAEIRNSRDYAVRLNQVPAETLKQLAIEWPLFLDSLIEAFDGELAFPVRRQFVDCPDPAGRQNGAPAEASTATVITGSAVTGSVTAAQGWQSPGRIFMTGQTIEVIAEGRFAMAQVPRPWISEPSGITIRYHRGRPLGELVAMLVAADGSRASRRVPVGRRMQISIPWDSELWLQLNDSAASRRDNSGEAVVTIRFPDGNRP